MGLKGVLLSGLPSRNMTAYLLRPASLGQYLGRVVSEHINIEAARGSKTNAYPARYLHLVLIISAGTWHEEPCLLLLKCFSPCRFTTASSLQLSPHVSIQSIFRRQLSVVVLCSLFCVLTPYFEAKVLVLTQKRVAFAVV